MEPTQVKVAELAKALASAQKEMKNPPLTKEAVVKYQNKERTQWFEKRYKYTDLATIMDLVRPILAKHGLSVSHVTGIHDGHFGLTTYLLHSSGESILSFYPLNQTDKAQEMGSQITYARRYTTTALLGIASEEDDDGELASQGKNEPKAKTEAKVESFNFNKQDAMGYKVKFGTKHRDQTLAEIGPIKLAEYVTYIESGLAKDKRQPNKDVAEFLAASKAFFSEQ
jgi:hypothetical protein